MPEQGKSGGEGQPNHEEELKEYHAKTQALEAKLSEAEKKAQIYDQIDAKYKADPKKRQEFDNWWYDQQAEGAKAAREVASTPEEYLKAELSASKEDLKKLRGEIDAMKGVFVSEKVSGGRNAINYKYEEEFQKLASEAGYDPGTPAYEILFDNAVKAGYDTARKLGMVNEAGVGDPLLRYNENFMPESFKVAYKKHKDAGFDVAWQRKQEAMKKKMAESQPDEYAEYLKPEKIKTFDQRWRLLEKMVRKKLGTSASIV